MLIVSVTTFDPVVALETTPDETLLTIQATGIAGVSAGFIVEVLGSGRASGADFLLARRAFLVSPAVPAEEFVLPPEVPPPEESEVVPEVEVVPELDDALEKFFSLPAPTRGRRTVIFSADAMRRTRRALGFVDPEAVDR